MATRKAMGRPTKVDYRIIIKLADAIQHNTMSGSQYTEHTPEVN